MNKNTMKIGLAQMSPVWLNKEKTLKKVEKFIVDAGNQKCDLVVFSEAILPGYPFWLSLTNGAEFNSSVQKEIYSHYAQNSIQIEKGELEKICSLAKENKISVYLGMIERAKDRGGHSLYCSLVYINQKGKIKSVHRKMQPTYEERLVWAAGDGNGLKVHELNNFTVGGLNCWENWMPLSRATLYGLGENVHIAVWPGAKSLTKEITRFIAKESRSYVISVGGLMKKEDIAINTPHFDKIWEKAPDILADGGSCVAGPDGEWIIEPQVGNEELLIAEIDFNKILEERQNFDLAGHYARPDITKLVVNTKRQSTIQIKK